MFKKKNRFTSQNFERLRKRMRSFRSGGFVFLYLPTKKQRFAVVISKKVEKQAVKRNKFRREVYALLKKQFANSQLSFSLICLYKGPELPKNSAAIKTSLSELEQFLVKKLK